MHDHERKLLEIIKNQVLIRNQKEQVNIYDRPETWLFDFRRILMNGHHANLISDIFYQKFINRYPFQLCALEIAGVPLVTSLMNKFYTNGVTDINAFFIRKSRKKIGLMRMIEGEIQETKKIILVDDALNTGNSFWRQIEILEELGYVVDTVWSIIRFRDMVYYQRFTDKGIKIESLFTLKDVGIPLQPNKNVMTPVTMPFVAKWVFQSRSPSLNYVIQKSQPVLDNEYIYVGSDTGYMRAISQKDGSVAWSYRIGFNTSKKGIFSSPIIYNDLVIFGGYDGNVHAVNKHTGKRIWVNTEADFIGSSPAIDRKHGLIFIGVEFGLIRKRGGIMAIDAQTGKTIWSDHGHQAMTHASPLFLPKTNEVVIGSNEGIIYMYDSRTGKQKWQTKTYGYAQYDAEQDGGFGPASIKLRPAFYAKKDYLVFTVTDGYTYVVHRKDGSIVYDHKTEFGSFSSPEVYCNYVYWAGTHKHIRCLDLDTLSMVWERSPDQTRIFSSPVVINKKLYVGTNAGRLHELDPLTGESLGYFQARERITNQIVHNPQTNLYYLPTYANEIICLEKNAEHTPPDTTPQPM